jgi:hypothetical protein
MRLTAAAVIAVLGIAALLWWVPRTLMRQPLHRYESSRLAYQVANLRAYAARDTLAGFLPREDAVIALREEFVQRALDLSLPFHEELPDAGYEAVLDTAVLRIEDGLASVRLAGRGRRRGETNPDRDVALSLRGYLNAERVHPVQGTLDLGLIITDVRSARTGPRMVRDWLRPAARYFASLKAEDWNRHRHVIGIPIRVDQRIEMPEVKGGVAIPGGTVSVGVRTSALTVYQRRVAVSLAFTELGGGASTESPWTEGLGEITAAASRLGRRLSEEQLIAERRLLEDRVRVLAERDSLWHAVRDTDRDICAAIPEAYLERLSRHFVRNYLRSTSIDFGPGLTAKFDKEIRARVLGKNVGAGRVRGVVRVLHLTGELSPDEDLDLTLRPPDRLELRVPVHAASGRGRLGIDVDWDPAFLTSLVCRGFQYSDTLTGVALPFSHRLLGTVQFAIVDSFLVGTTRVRRDRVSIPVSPLPGSRERVLKALQEQDKTFRCGIAMNADSLLDDVLGLLRRGVVVRLPARLFPEFRIPVTLVDEYVAGEYRIHASAYDPEFRVRASCLQMGFRARFRVEPAPDSSSISAGPRWGPAPLRPAPRRSWGRTTPGSDRAARSRAPSWSTPGASGACAPPAGRAVRRA